MTRTFLTRLPIFGCAGFIAFLFLANIWNFAVERDYPKLRIRSAAPLAGVARPKPTPWTVEAFLSGETQKAVSINLGRALPVFPISVRAKNQLIFSLFGKSAASGVVIGRNGQLYEQFYIDEFCARGGAPDLAHIDQWAQDIRDIQDMTEAAGKRFVFLVSPSKAARLPEELPPEAVCAARATTMPAKLPSYLSALQAKGVHFVDGAGFISANRKAYPIPLFPRGGTHWNYLGAALVYREIAHVIAAPAVADYNFEWSVPPQATGTDRDLADLMNLLWPDLSYPTAAVARASAPPEGCGAGGRLLALGGSFVHEILATAAHAPCPPTIDYWFFMRTEDNTVELGHYRRPPGEDGNGERREVGPAALNENLRDADVVLLEENESKIGTMKQIGELRAALRALH